LSDRHLHKPSKKLKSVDKLTALKRKKKPFWDFSLTRQTGAVKKIAAAKSFLFFVSAQKIILLIDPFI